MFECDICHKSPGEIMCPRCRGLVCLDCISGKICKSCAQTAQKAESEHTATMDAKPAPQFGAVAVQSAALQPDLGTGGQAVGVDLTDSLHDNPNQTRQGMRYEMKKKWFALSESLVVRDASGQSVYTIQAAILSLNTHLTVQDMTGSELATIDGRIFSFPSTYEYFEGGARKAVIKKDFWSFFAPKFSVELSEGSTLEIQGDFLNHEYTFARAGTPVAQVSMAWFAFTDTYGVEVSGSIDPVLVLACAAIIDVTCHEHRDSGIGAGGGLIDDIGDLLR